MTALTLATIKDHLDSVQALLDRGADINAQHPVTLESSPSTVTEPVTTEVCLLNVV